MKILFYNHTGKVGGAEGLLMMILARLDRKRFEPVFVCPRPGPLQMRVEELAVPVENVSVLEARFTWRPDHLVRHLRSFLRVILQFRKTVTRTKADLIHANSIRAGLVATTATIGLGSSVVWHVHDLLPRHPLTPLIRIFALLSTRTRMIAVSEASAARFVGDSATLKNRLTVIHNGIDLNEFSSNEKVTETIRADLQLRETEPVIGIVGRLTPRKGQLGLLRIFPRVLSEFPTAKLLVVGAPVFGREKEYLQLLQRTASELGISNRVIFLGRREDVPAIMRSLDLLVVNSSVEAFCLVALEAMACGTPVLATVTGGLPELIESGKDGWLVPVGDDSALASAIVKLLGEPALRARLARNGSQRVARFSADRYMTEIQNFYLTSYPSAISLVNYPQSKAENRHLQRQSPLGTK